VGEVVLHLIVQHLNLSFPLRSSKLYQDLKNHLSLLHNNLATSPVAPSALKYHFSILAGVSIHTAQRASNENMEAI